MRFSSLVTAQNRRSNIDLQLLVIGMLLRIVKYVTLTIMYNFLHVNAMFLSTNVRASK